MCIYLYIYICFYSILVHIYHQYGSGRRGRGEDTDIERERMRGGEIREKGEKKIALLSKARATPVIIVHAAPAETSPTPPYGGSPC